MPWWKAPTACSSGFRGKAGGLQAVPYRCLFDDTAVLHQSGLSLPGRESWMSQGRSGLPAHCRDIPLPRDWQGIALVEKGWSRDIKYRVSTRSGRDYLLRLNKTAPAVAKRQEFVFVLRLHETGLGGWHGSRGGAAGVTSHHAVSIGSGGRPPPACHP